MCHEGSLWSLAGALLYAVYIVMIKRRVDREDRLDIPMFFGEQTVSYVCHACVRGVESLTAACPLRVCRSVQPCVAVARLPAAALLGPGGLPAAQPPGLDLHPGERPHWNCPLRVPVALVNTSHYLHLSSSVFQVPSELFQK